MLRLPVRQRRRLTKLGSVFILLFAIAPQVLYLGHPLNDDQVSAAVQSAPPGHEQHAEAAAEHAGHCHVGPKGCAAAGGIVNVASFDAAIQLLENSETATVIENTPLPQGFALWQRPEKPPQPV
jgi:hypothetical protein